MKKLNKLTLTALLFTSISLSASGLSQKAANGQEFYLDADCQKCHNQDSKYDAKKKKSKNMKDLNKWVRSCDTFFDVGWFPEEQQDVIKYLNEIYYKY
ncbi:MAG TPA: hypothetical protein EYG97_04280 [Arcobacter sp.]|nr:hypothetical protein [Arcobacter sp.]HIP56222.1 hypothetical protein [Arcobacter sp.]